MLLIVFEQKFHFTYSYRQQAYSGAQTLQMIILLSTGTNKNGGYFASKSVFLAMFMGQTIIWAVLNNFSLQVIAFLDLISIWWQVILNSENLDELIF